MFLKIAVRMLISVDIVDLRLFPCLCLLSAGEFANVTKVFTVLAKLLSNCCVLSYLRDFKFSSTPNALHQPIGGFGSFLIFFDIKNEKDVLLLCFLLLSQYLSIFSFCKTLNTLHWYE